MLEAIRKMFGGSSTDLREVIQNGAVIIDVRSTGEYSTGHAKGSVNIPLDRLQAKLSGLDKNKPVITCCASGMRSSSAKSLLLSNGFKEVHNAGPWQNILKYQ
ncbi:MAG: rhodanese-like domain-containing protein [Flavipsychrobacter sp.]|nr:rhodanese-like domain-containing protein [Flavipsychrobacter sp.]